jgi:SAM-dependent methyltransferase
VEGVPREIIEHYQSIDEGSRITEGLAQLELIRTKEVLGRHLPAPPARILDVGGATGVHAAWIAAGGHTVHVVDLVPHHVERASRLEVPAGQVTAEIADGRSLPLDDASFDAVLLFGPLYHLTDRADRVRAWSEARRVVRRGGFVFAAAISRFASLFDGLARGFLFDPEFRHIAERDLLDGRHQNPNHVPHWFTTAYLHRPEELRGEAGDAGLEVIELVGVEGMAGWMPHLGEQWSTPEGREAILFAARAVEAEPALLGLSAHLIAISRKA